MSEENVYVPSNDPFHYNLYACSVCGEEMFSAFVVCDVENVNFVDNPSEFKDIKGELVFTTLDGGALPSVCKRCGRPVTLPHRLPIDVLVSVRSSAKQEG